MFLSRFAFLKKKKKMLADGESSTEGRGIEEATGAGFTRSKRPLKSVQSVQPSYIEPKGTFIILLTPVLPAAIVNTHVRRHCQYINRAGLNFLYILYRVISAQTSDCRTEKLLPRFRRDSPGQRQRARGTLRSVKITLSVTQLVAVSARTIDNEMK